MTLKREQLAELSRLLDEALPLDEAGRRAWLEKLPAEYQALTEALRAALFPDSGESEKLSALPKILGAHEPGTSIAGDLEPGSRVGPYELICRLGAGGMAEVWLAKRADGAFKREVALKLPMLTRLGTELAERFARERDILASLEHPHIARLYDAGVDAEGLPYIAMEYVPGASLISWCDENKLGIEARLALFLRVLEAVQYAHEKQVIHRDLKPSNILATESGQVRLLDFGVAKLIAGQTDEPQLTSLYGRALTADYASPELLAGDPIDARSDVYSLGVVLYELLSGGRPYRLRSAASLGMLEQAISTVEVKRPSTQVDPQAAAARSMNPGSLTRQLKGDLDAIVMKALAKDPAERYGSVAAMRDDLRLHIENRPIKARLNGLSYRLSKFVVRHGSLVAVSVVAGVLLLGLGAYEIELVSVRPSTSPNPPVNQPPPAFATLPAAVIPEKSVAVLPFIDMSEKHDQGYFSDGLAEELTDTLTNVPELRVPARTSSFYFKGKQERISEIARELVVAYLLEGSVRKSGDHVRITVQLVRGDSGYHLWSETYDRQLLDVFKVQDEIAEAVVRALKISLLDGELPNAALTSSNDAYEFYLQARSLLRSGTSDDALKAYADLQHALLLDPKFVLAWATLAEMLSDDFIDWSQIFKPGDLPSHPRDADHRLNPSWTDADIDQNWGYSWAQARAAAHSAAERAVMAGPEIAAAHAAMGVVLKRLDRNWTAAEIELRKARDLAPANANIMLTAAMLAMALGRLDEAQQLTNRALTLDPLGDALSAMSFIQYVTGDLEGAQASVRREIELYPTETGVHDRYARILLARGDPRAALAELEREEAPQYRDVGRPFALDALGRRSEADRAIALAERKWAHGMAWNIACFYGSRDDAEHTFQWLERAYDQHDGGMNELKISPDLKNLRSDPRYKALLHRMNLPD
jgi:eukaryotic-like serine/threonine-protein kinase